MPEFTGSEWMQVTEASTSPPVAFSDLGYLFLRFRYR